MLHLHCDFASHHLGMFNAEIKGLIALDYVIIKLC